MSLVLLDAPSQRLHNHLSRIQKTRRKRTGAKYIYHRSARHKGTVQKSSRRKGNGKACYGIHKRLNSLGFPEEFTTPLGIPERLHNLLIFFRKHLIQISIKHKGNAKSTRRKGNGTAPTISRLRELLSCWAARCALFLLLLWHPLLSCTPLIFWSFHIATRCQSALVHCHQLIYKGLSHT